MSVKGVLLDIDGTLVDSNDAHANAYVQAFSEHGYEVEFEKVRSLIGMGGDQLIPRIVPSLSGEEGEGKEIADRRKELIIEKFGSELEPTQGSRDLIEKLKQSGYELVISSSATTEELSVLLKAAQVDDLLDMDLATTSSDAEKSKPDPDLIEVTLEKGHLKADEAIMLGDTPYDIQAANAAGVDVIAFRTGGFSDEELANAIEIYDSPADLLAHFDQSAFASRN
ncbi:HAD family hydrolase [Leptolyngbya sp. AN03gr2]|uniref:HAD family hydrolase n=1 Tax=unclassified Leptolyngbya TaxID=2650499 RepID=UPI003D3219A0